MAAIRKMAKLKNAVAKPQTETGDLEGWQQIAAFLGQPLSVAQRWEKSGMPVSRIGRRVHAPVQDLDRWLGRESHAEPVHITTDSADLSSELSRGLSYVRKHRRVRNRKPRTA
jgi:hypothetical protein